MPNEPIVIEFRTEGADDLDRVVTPLSSKIDRLGDQIDKLATAFGAVASAGSGAASGVSRAASAVRSTASAARAATGPLQALAKAQQDLAKAQASGDPTAIFDAQHKVSQKQLALQRAHNTINRANNPVFDMLSTSRVFMQNGKAVISPLLNRVAAAGGIPPGLLSAVANLGTGGAGSGAAALGAAAGPVAAAVAGIAVLGASAKIAADRLTKIGKLTIGGASPGEASAAMRLGAATGSDVQAQARAFSDAIAEGGLGNIVARRLGINPQNNVYNGDLNDVGKLIRAVEALTDKGLMSDDAARRFARAAGLEEFLSLRNASPEVRRMALDRDRERRSPAEIQAATDAQIRLNIAMDDFKRSMTDLGVSILPAINRALKIMQDAAKWVEQRWGNAGGLSPNGDEARRGKPGESMNAQEAQRRAIESNTKAIERNTNAQLANGTYGGGSRGRDLPLGQMWNAWQNSKQAEAVSWGALTP